MEVSLAALLLSTALPVIKVALMCCVGAWCSRQGTLTVEGRRIVSGLTFNVFLPCLNFEKLAEFSFGEVAKLWPLSANMVLSHVIGAAIGSVMLALTRGPGRLAAHTMLATSVGNVGNLPLVLVDSLATGPGMQLLGPSVHRGLQYIMVSNITASFIQFPVVKWVLQKSDVDGSGNSASNSANVGPTASNQNWQMLWQACATPPIIATIAALCVGQIPTAQHALFSPSGALHLVGEVCKLFSNMAIPALMLVLGANLAEGPGTAAVPASSIAAVAIGRLLLLPLAGTALVALSARAGWLGSMDPTAMVVMMMMNAMPTALMVHNVATMYSNQQDEVAVFLFWQYLAALCTLPLLMALFLRTAATLCAPA